MITVLVVAGAVPVVVAILAAGMRSPRGVLVPLYAVLVPFGSSIALPLPLPSPFNTATTLIGLLAAGALGAELIFLRRAAPRILPEVVVWLAFVGNAAVTYLWSVRPARTLEGVGILLSLLLLYVLYSLVGVGVADVRRLELGIVLGGVIACAWGFALLATGNLPEEKAGLARFSLSGGVGDAADPNITAAVLVLPLVVAVGLALRPGRRHVRLVATGSAAVIAAGVLLTASRGGVLAAALGTFVVIAHGRRRSLTLVSAIVGAALVVVLLSLSAPEQVGRLTASGSSGRTNIWRTGAVACGSHCARGSGLGTFPDVQEVTLLSTPTLKGFRLGEQPHNLWLGIGVETGVVGLVLVVAAMGLSVRTLWRINRDDRATALAGLVGLLVSNAFLANLRFKYFWLVLMYAAAVGLAYGRPRATLRVAFRQRTPVLAV